jgi:hypothetical protein
VTRCGSGGSSTACLQSELFDDGDDRHGSSVDRQVAGVNACLYRAERFADGGAAADG